ncbi:MAG: hypothetical protein AAF555_00345 [Verrucomicrobiota bacterium]
MQLKSLLPLLLSVPLLGQAQEIETLLAGVRIVYQDMADDFKNFRTFNAQNGLAFSIGLRGTGSTRLIDFEKETSTIHLLTSDQAEPIALQPGFPSRFSDDARAARIEFKSDALPPAEASFYRLEGSISLLVAQDQETILSAATPFEKGSTVSLGEDLVFKIEKLGKPQWGEMPVQVSLQIARDIPEIAAFRFFDGTGKKLEMKEAGSSRMGMFNKVTVTRTFNLAEKPEALIVEVDVWQNLQKQEVPVALAVPFPTP